MVSFRVDPPAARSFLILRARLGSDGQASALNPEGGGWPKQEVVCQTQAVVKSLVGLRRSYAPRQLDH